MACCDVNGKTEVSISFQLMLHLFCDVDSSIKALNMSNRLPGYDDFTPSTSSSSPLFVLFL